MHCQRPADQCWIVKSFNLAVEAVHITVDHCSAGIVSGAGQSCTHSEFCHQVHKQPQVEICAECASGSRLEVWQWQSASACCATFHMTVHPGAILAVLNIQLNYTTSRTHRYTCEVTLVSSAGQGAVKTLAVLCRLQEVCLTSQCSSTICISCKHFAHQSALRVTPSFRALGHPLEHCVMILVRILPRAGKQTREMFT